MTILVLALLAHLANAAEVARGGSSGGKDCFQYGGVRVCNDYQDYNRKNDTLRNISLDQWLKMIPGGAPAEDEDVEEIQRLYNSEKRDAKAFKPYEPAPSGGEYEQTAKECGESKQRECSPANFGGRTMCGRSVAMMLKCMSTRTGGDSSCTGACGNGKDFVNCGKGEMEKCGYSKIDASDPRCKQAGAVLAYAQSPTARGALYGHVEFVCGTNRFCSVYKEPHDRPWPRNPADACWFPKAAGNSKGDGK